MNKNIKSILKFIVLILLISFFGYVGYVYCKDNNMDVFKGTIIGMLTLFEFMKN